MTTRAHGGEGPDGRAAGDPYGMGKERAGRAGHVSADEVIEVPAGRLPAGQPAQRRSHPQIRMGGRRGHEEHT